MKKGILLLRGLAPPVLPPRVPKRTYGFRPHRPGRSRKLHCRRRVAGHGRLRPSSPLADTEKPITNATRLKTHGGKIYIQDEETNCLHVFHADGTLDFSIDRRGKAGNEYLWIRTSMSRTNAFTCWTISAKDSGM